MVRLRERGNAVRVLDLRQHPSWADDHGIQAIEGSVTDPSAVSEAVRGIEHVYHLAGVADLWAKDAAIFDSVNTHSVDLLIKASKEAGVDRFLYCSSATTLVAQQTPIGPSTADEALTWAPTDLLGAYPASKRRGELLVEEAARNEFHAVIVNPTEPAGAGDEAITPPTRMMLDFLNGKTPAYIDCILNFAPVAEIALGMIAAVEKGKAGERYILGGENIEMRELLDLLAELSGRSMPKTKLPYAVGLAAGVLDTHLVARFTGKSPKAPLTGVRLAGRRVAFQSDKAARELGWRAGPARPALQEMIAWAGKNGLVER